MQNGGGPDGFQAGCQDDDVQGPHPSASEKSTAAAAAESGLNVRFTKSCTIGEKTVLLTEEEKNTYELTAASGSGGIGVAVAMEVLALMP